MKRVENKPSVIFKCGYLLAHMEDEHPWSMTSNAEQLIDIEFYQGEWGLSGNIGLWVPWVREKAEKYGEDYWQHYGWWSFLSFCCSPEADGENTRVDIFYSTHTFFERPGDVIRSFKVSNKMLPRFDASDIDNFDGNDFYDYNLIDPDESMEPDEPREGVIGAWQFLLDIFSEPFGFREVPLIDPPQETSHPDFHFRRFPAKLSF